MPEGIARLARAFPALAALGIPEDRAVFEAGAEPQKQRAQMFAMAAPCDVSQEAQVSSLGKDVLGRFGQIDVIVNNAGLMTFHPIEELSADDIESVLRVDLFGAFFFTKLGFLQMRPGSAIVNMSSIHAVETTPGVARVNAVLPGAIDTPMLWDNPNVKSGLEKIERTDVGTAEDVAQLIAFLASDDAKFVQGAAVRVDGGRWSRL